MGRPKGSKAKEVIYNQEQDVVVDKQDNNVEVKEQVVEVEQKQQNPEFVDKQVLVPGGRRNNDDERIIKIEDESCLESMSKILTGYNPQTKEARIRVI